MVGVPNVVGGVTYQWPEDVIQLLGQNISTCTPIIYSGPKGVPFYVFYRVHKIYGELHLWDSLLYVLSPSQSCALIVLSMLMSLFLCWVVGFNVMGL